MNKEDIKNIWEEKLNSQERVPTLFDRLIKNTAIKNVFNNSDETISRFRKLFENLMDSKSSRFSTYEQREKEVCEFSKKKSSLDEFTFLLSQGTHSTIKWKGLSLYKSVFDMVIYMQLLSEIKPDVIVEYGSGTGGSALWLYDVALSLNIDVSIHSYDIKKPDLTSRNIYFEEIDLTKDLPELSKLKGKKLVIEDAHRNIENVLLNADSFLSSGDYLVVEDSENKSKYILNFLSKAKNKYMVDNFYADFFGKNSSTAINSIFIVV